MDAHIAQSLFLVIVAYYIIHIHPTLFKYPKSIHILKIKEHENGAMKFISLPY
jgi:hypothetical protein